MDLSHALTHEVQARPLLAWFALDTNRDCAERLGFQFAPGGVHLSKTMMLTELATIMNATGSEDKARRAILDDNVLGKNTGKGRQLALKHLNRLYGLAAALHLWPRNVLGRPMLALLCALAREPLMRQTAGVVLGALRGTRVQASDLAAALASGYPNRYSANTLQSLARNCASTWTQSGHLTGMARKCRAVAEPSPEAAAYAALLGTLAGFGGPALLQSPWMRLLDRPEADLLLLLRRAEAIGLAKVRAGGGVVQITVRQPLADLLEVPALADGG